MTEKMKFYLLAVLTLIFAWENPIKMVAEETTPAILTVSGPNGTALRFSKPEQGYYQQIEVLRPGQRPVPIHLIGGNEVKIVLVDGTDADGRNHLFKFKPCKDAKWSLRLWSLDGRYVVLVTYDLIDNRIDIKNDRYTTAYDTMTGEPVDFSSKEQHLGNDSFRQWSQTKPDVAILFTGGNPSTEEAFPVKN